MKIERTELLRYLGWRGQPLDGITTSSLERMSARCLEVAAPRSVVRRFAYANGALSDTGVKLEGADIAKHLSGVDRTRTYATYGCKPHGRSRIRRRGVVRYRKLPRRALRGARERLGENPSSAFFLRIRRFPHIGAERYLRFTEHAHAHRRVR